jgi:GT2 family glycosyltransferase
VAASGGGGRAVEQAAASIRAAFDAGYYLTRYSDVQESGVDPLQHYLSCGIKEHRSPCAWFDPVFYLKSYPELARHFGPYAKQFGPFAHYLAKGRSRGLLPCADFTDYENPRIRLFVKWLFSRNVNRKYYKMINHEHSVGCSMLEQLYSDKYLEHGAPLPSFDLDVRAVPQEVRHWHLLHLYIVKQLDQSQLDLFKKFTQIVDHTNPIYAYMRASFNEDVYSAYNALGKTVDPFQHYLGGAWLDDLDPSPRFCTAYYLEEEPDVAGAGVNPFWHFSMFGGSERRKGIPALFRASSEQMDNSMLLHMLRNLANADWHARFQSPEYRPDVTVIVPIYRAKNEVAALLHSLQETVQPDQHVVLVDDFSNDEELTTHLASWVASRPGAKLETLPANVGFSGACNIGIALAPAHVVVVNSDTVPAAGWLGRIMAPIDRDPAVGSVIPFSNTSSVSGFPTQQCEDELYLGADINTIDRVFGALPSDSLDVVSGCGFFMAMSKDALATVGAFDDRTYPNGYYEDTDWCQRASKAHFRNVIAANLFVRHNPGSASYSKEKRVRFSNRNRIMFDRSYPEYQRNRQAELMADSYAGYRRAAKVGCWLLSSMRRTIYIEHGWGGGVASAIRTAVDEALARGDCCVVVRAKDRGYELEIAYQSHVDSFGPLSLDACLALLSSMDSSAIEIHAAHSLAQPQKTLIAFLECLRPPITARMYVHDFYVVCPSQHLLDWRGNYCHVPDRSVCDRCLPRNPYTTARSISVHHWRRLWDAVFNRISELVIFDESARSILNLAFDPRRLPRITIESSSYSAPKCTVPHKIAPVLTRLAFCGAISHHKGSGVVRALAEYVSKHRSDITLIVIGELMDGRPAPANVHVTGRYDSDNLGALLNQHKVELVIFASICPETFSYTLTEIFAAGIPCVGLDIGAQGRRIREHPLGRTTSNFEPRQLLMLCEKHIQTLSESING